MDENNIMKMLVTNNISTLEYNSELIINGELVIRDTIYIYNRFNKKYLQLYYDGEKFIIYKTFDEIPVNNKIQRIECIQHSLKILKENLANV